MSEDRTSSYRNLMAALIILIAALLSLSRHIHDGLYYDDARMVEVNPRLDSISEIPGYFVDPSAFSGSNEIRMYRPGTLTAICLVKSSSPENAKLFNLAAMLFHALCSYLLFHLASKLSGNTVAPLAAALIFAVHPVAGEPVGYASAIGLPVALAMLFGSIIFTLDKEFTPLKSIILPSLLAFAAMLTREDAAVYPALLALFLLAIPKLNNKSARLLAGSITLAIYLAVRVAVNIQTLPAATIGRSRLDNLFTQAAALLHYLKLFLFPSALSAEQSFPPGWLEGMLPIAGALVAAAFILGGLWLFMVREKRPFAFIGVFWLIISLLPSSSVVVLNQVVNDRRAYIPLAGVLVALGASNFFKKLVSDPRGKAIACTILILLASLNLGRGELWQSESLLFRDAVQKSPKGIRALFAYAKALEREGQLIKAIRAYRQTQTIANGDHILAQNNLGTCYSKLGMRDKAIEAYTELTKMAPDFELGYFNLGTELIYAERHEEAIKPLKKAVGLQSGMAAAHLNLAVAYLKTDRKKLAIVELEKAMELDPSIDYRNEVERLKQELNQ